MFFFISYDSLVSIRKLRNHVYSEFIRRYFNKCGKYILIDYPAVLLGGKYIEIGDNFRSFSRLRLEAHDHHNEMIFAPRIIIGDNSSLNFDCHIACINKVEIGHHVLIGSRVFITDHYHGEITKDALLSPPNERKLYSPGPVIIQDNVWIGEGVSIMPNVTIGANSIIGANAVVTKSFPLNSIIAGVPARLIRSI